MFLSDYGDMPIDEASRLAEEAARRAMELDPGAAEPYASMGLILDYRQRAEAAMAYYDRALAINPNYVNALGWKANALADFGRFRDALVLAEQAYDLDPLSNFAKSGVINAAAAAGQFDRAETLIREMIAEYPDDPLGYEEYGNWHFALGQLDAAVPYFIAAHPGTTDQDTVLNVPAAGILGNDSDPNGDSLGITQINGAAYTPGSQITLPSGALLTVAADGGYQYDPNGVYNALGSGNTATDVSTATISDVPADSQ